MPILRWIRQTESSMPSASSASLPRQHVLIDAVDQRSVEIEEKDRFDAHFRSNVHDWAKVQKRLPDESFTALTTSLPGPLVTPPTVSHSESEQGMRCGIH
jgi:hypothetical protein